MTVLFSRRLPLAACASFIILSASLPAQAYGPEGLFGGRLNPDNTVVFDNPVEIDDRPLRAQTVLQHPRPDFDPVSKTVGSWEFFPSIEFGVSGDSNIYATPEDEAGDLIFNARPILNVFSNWNRHAVSMSSYADFTFYEDHDVENVNTFVTDLRGRYDLDARTWIAAHAGYQYLADPRGDVNTAVGDEPGTFNVYKTGVSVYRGRGILHAGIDHEMTIYQYNDIPAAGGSIDQSGRDRISNQINTRLIYNLTENLKPYISGGYVWSLYDTSNIRDSQGYEAVVGATADFGGITSGEIFVGWMSRNYDGFAYAPEHDAVKFGGRLEWNVTGLTTLVAEVNRTIEETTSTDFNSYLSTGGSMTLTHELRRNLLLEAQTTFTHNDFNGLGSLTDDNVALGGGLRWLINRSLYSDVVYEWSRRFSGNDPAEYSRHLVSARIGIQL